MLNHPITFQAEQFTMDFNMTGSGATQMFALAALATASLALIVNIIFAIGVYRHAEFRNPMFAGPVGWTLATLLAGPFMAVAYWLVHVSALAKPYDRNERTEQKREAPQHISVPAFECPSCNHTASAVTADGRCVHCGARVKPA